MNSSVSDNILIVDADEFCAKVIQWQLGFAGFDHIVIFTDPRAAIESMRAAICGPAVVITEFSLPHMNGCKLLDEVKKCHSAMKGIIVTANFSLIPKGIRYPIYSKYSREIISDFIGIVDVFRSIIRPLCVKCPINLSSHRCPFSEVRQLSTADKASWLSNLTARSAQSMIRAHQTCLERTIENHLLRVHEASS